MEHRPWRKDLGLRDLDPGRALIPLWESGRGGGRRRERCGTFVSSSSSVWGRQRGFKVPCLSFLGRALCFPFVSSFQRGFPDPPQTSSNPWWATPNPRWATTSCFRVMGCGVGGDTGGRGDTWRPWGALEGCGRLWGVLPSLARGFWEGLWGGQAGEDTPLTQPCLPQLHPMRMDQRMPPLILEVSGFPRSFPCVLLLPLVTGTTEVSKRLSWDIPHSPFPLLSTPSLHPRCPPGHVRPSLPIPCVGVSLSPPWLVCPHRSQE